MSFLSGLATAVQGAVEDKIEHALAGQDSQTAALLEKLGVGKVVDGIKEALCIGIDKAVEVCGAADGYLGNESIRLPMPPQLALVADKVRELGLGQVIDSFEEAMNRAAEKAAPLSLDIVKSAIRDMGIDDVKRVWKGGDDSCTKFMQHTCNGSLKEVMRGACEEVLHANQVTHFYEKLVDVVREVPIVGDLAAQYDIRDYTLQKTLDGLYKMMADQEKKIRQDPAQRTTDLLSEVFGGA